MSPAKRRNIRKHFTIKWEPFAEKNYTCVNTAQYPANEESISLNQNHVNDHLPRVKMAKIKETRTKGAAEDVDRQEPSARQVGRRTGAAAMESGMELPQKSKSGTTV